MNWFNYVAAGKILLFGMLVGAALPALFALATRVSAVASNAGAPSTGAARKTALVAVSWAIYALVLLVVVVGVLFVARDFIGHHIGWYILGAKPGK